MKFTGEKFLGKRKEKEDENSFDDFSGGSSDLLTDSMGRMMKDPTMERSRIIKLLDGTTQEQSQENIHSFFSVINQFKIDNDIFFTTWIREMEKRAENLEKLISSFNRTEKEIAGKMWKPIEKYILDKKVLEEMKHGEHPFSFVEAFLSHYNLNNTDIFEAWTSGTSRDDQGIFLRNLITIAKIEEKEPNIASVLYKEFGIRNFQRYPTELLFHQYNSRDNQELEYGVVLNPTHDYNGAFEMNENLWKMFMYDAGNEGCLLRIAEARNKEEVQKRLISLHRKYGNKHKISFMLLGGHGTQNSIKFGDPDRGETLKIDDVIGGEKLKLNRVFNDNPQFVLVSCSTGKEGGIAQKLSKVMHGSVQAPLEDTNISAVYISRDGVTNKLNLHMEYGRSSSVFYENGEKA